LARRPAWHRAPTVRTPFTAAEVQASSKITSAVSLLSLRQTLGKVNPNQLKGMAEIHQPRWIMTTTLPLFGDRVIGKLHAPNELAGYDRLAQVVLWQGVVNEKEPS
jgi:hypothetical protein